MGLRDRLNRISVLRDETTKFDKGQAYYISDATQKPFRCANCFHFQNGDCRLVSSDGEPSPGRIDPEGACSLYNARGPRIQTLQMLWGRGVFDGVAPEKARATAFMFTYAALDEEVPESIERKALFGPGSVR
jgi:hypothetical protein